MKAIVAALAVNMAIAIAKGIGFAFTGSASLLAESMHSLADTGNQGLLLFGDYRSRRPADASHPFGYGSERYFWAFVVALVLFALGSLAALYEGIVKLIHPHVIESPQWAIGILAISMLLEGASLRTAYREAKPLRGALSWRQFIRQTKHPELSVVLLEDAGALVGLLLALAGMLTAIATGNDRFDAIGSLAIGILLAGIAALLATKNKSFLIGESAGPETIGAITEAIVASRLVVHLIHLRTLQLGPDDLLVVAKVEFQSHLDHHEVALAIDEVEALIRAAAPQAHLVFLEPDRLRSPDQQAP